MEWKPDSMTNIIFRPNFSYGKTDNLSNSESGTFNSDPYIEERYLLPEIMQVPERADEQVFYQIMKMAEKSMLERLSLIHI